MVITGDYHHFKFPAFSPFYMHGYAVLMWILVNDQISGSSVTALFFIGIFSQTIIIYSVSETVMSFNDIVMDLHAHITKPQ